MGRGAWGPWGSFQCNELIVTYSPVHSIEAPRKLRTAKEIRCFSHRALLGLSIEISVTILHATVSKPRGAPNTSNEGKGGDVAGFYWLVNGSAYEDDGCFLSYLWHAFKHGLNERGCIVIDLAVIILLEGLARLMVVWIRCGGMWWVIYRSPRGVAGGGW